MAGFAGQGQTGKAFTGAHTYPLETGHAFTGESFTGAKSGTKFAVIATAGLAMATAMAMGPTASVPAAPPTPAPQGQTGVAFTGLSFTGGSPAPVPTGLAFVGLSPTGGINVPLATNVTVTAGLAQATAIAEGATVPIIAGDLGFFWGVYGASGGVYAQFNAPNQVPDVGSVGTPTPLGAVQQLIAENGWAGFIIGGVPYGIGANANAAGFTHVISQGTTGTDDYYTTPLALTAASGSSATADGLIAAGAVFPILQVDGGDGWAWCIDSSNPGGPGTSYVYAWGNNTVPSGGSNFGVMGNATPTSAQNPIQPTPVQVLGVGGVGLLELASFYGAISGGAGHCVGITPAGKVVACGLDTYGECGVGVTGTTHPLPVQVLTGVQGDSSGFLSDIVYVSVGDYHSLALDNSVPAKVYAWGRDFWGQLGDQASGVNPVSGGGPNRTTPVLVDFAGVAGFVGPVSAICGGGGTTSDGHSLFLDQGSGNVFSSGNNTFGQLGLGVTGTPNTNSTSTPSLVQLAAAGAVLPILKIAAGGRHSLALDSANQVWAWGDNHLGTLGLGGTPGSGGIPLTTSIPHRVINLPAGTVNLLFAGNGTSIVDAENGTSPVNITVIAGLAQATTTAEGAQASTNITATAGLAMATAEAQGATAKTTTNATATAGLATAYAQALSPQAAIPATNAGPFVGRIV